MSSKFSLNSQDIEFEQSNAITMDRRSLRTASGYDHIRSSSADNFVEQEEFDNGECESMASVSTGSSGMTIPWYRFETFDRSNNRIDSRTAYFPRSGIATVAGKGPNPCTLDYYRSDSENDVDDDLESTASSEQFVDVMNQRSRSGRSSDGNDNENYRPESDNSNELRDGDNRSVMWSTPSKSTESSGYTVPLNRTHRFDPSNTRIHPACPGLEYLTSRGQKTFARNEYSYSKDYCRSASSKASSSSTDEDSIKRLEFEMYRRNSSERVHEWVRSTIHELRTCQTADSVNSMNGVKSMPHSDYGAKSTSSSVVVPSVCITDGRPLSNNLSESNILSPNRSTTHKTVRGTLHGIKSRSTEAAMKSTVSGIIANSDYRHQTDIEDSQSAYLNEYYRWNSVKSNRITAKSVSIVPRSMYTSDQTSLSDSLSKPIVLPTDRPNVHKMVRGTINGIKPRMIAAVAKSTVGAMIASPRLETDTGTGRRRTLARSFSASDQELSSDSFLGLIVPSPDLPSVFKIVRGTLHGIKPRMIAAASSSTKMAKTVKITPADQGWFVNSRNHEAISGMQRSPFTFENHEEYQGTRSSGFQPYIPPRSELEQYFWYCE